MKVLVLAAFVGFAAPALRAQNSAGATDAKVQQLIEKKAEFHRLTGGQQNGYRINIHFGVDREKSKAVKTKFAAHFTEYEVDEEYQQPNWVVLVGAFKTKLDAFAAFKRIKDEFPNAFIVTTKIKP